MQGTEARNLPVQRGSLIGPGHTGGGGAKGLAVQVGVVTWGQSDGGRGLQDAQWHWYRDSTGYNVIVVIVFYLPYGNQSLHLFLLNTQKQGYEVLEAVMSFLLLIYCCCHHVCRGH